MPIAFDPNATTDICLESDKARPEKDRVYFRCRYITDRERRKVWELRLQRGACTTDEELDALITAALSIGVIGPVNAKARDGTALPCTVDAISDVLSYIEKLALIDEYPLAVSASEWDKKKLQSPSPSVAESATSAGAGAAPATPANAPTAPA
jgi:hypothetical protein